MTIIFCYYAISIGAKLEYDWIIERKVVIKIYD